jgi:uncharacterized protein (TIGR03118 family)
MKMIIFSFHSSRMGRSLATALFGVGLQLVFLLFPLSSLRAWGENDRDNTFNWKNLQSDIDGVADRTDPNLVNPWGLAINPNANIFWVADNGKSVSTLYRPDGTRVNLVVTIPATSTSPTGTVFNQFAGSGAFPISTTRSGGNGQPAIFIFDGEDGGISAWNGGTAAILVFDNSASGAVYKGLALAVRPNGDPTLYATNFHSGRVDIFDSQFHPVTIARSFVDPNPPGVPTGAVGWGPFNIASINAQIYVTFAAQKPGKRDDLAGAGNGFVDVFNTEGAFIKRLITGGPLNSPWGLARVPDDSSFGKFKNDVLLVGNFGDGLINAFKIHSGVFLAQLQHRQGQPLAFNGLWSLFFFNDRLYFTAGIVDEADGLFGFIRPAEREQFDK